MLGRGEGEGWEFCIFAVSGRVEGEGGSDVYLLRLREVREGVLYLCSVGES